MRNGDSQRGFTLVELIIVLGLLAIVAAISMPSLARSMRERNLPDEAARFLAMTEYARNEAVSQGVPMIVWIDPATQRFGVEPRAGFSGDETREKSFRTNEDVRFEIDRSRMRDGMVEVAEFSPEGAPTPASLEAVVLKDRFGSELTVSRSTDGWSYEIVRPTR